MQANIVTQKWILLFFEIFGLHFTNEKSFLSVCYQLILISIVIGNYFLYYVIQKNFYGSSSITGIVIYIECN